MTVTTQHPAPAPRWQTLSPERARQLYMWVRDFKRAYPGRSKTTSDFYLIALTKCSTPKFAEQHPSFLRVVVRNLILSLGRDRRRRPRAEPDEDTVQAIDRQASADGEHEVMIADAAARMSAFLTMLERGEGPGKHIGTKRRARIPALVHLHLEGHTNEEIADALGICKTLVTNELEFVRTKLQSALNTLDPVNP